MDFDLGGIVGSEKYYGAGKLSDVRDRNFLEDKTFPKKIEVRNWRQWSAVSVEELAQIAQKLDTGEIDPSLLGANISFSGVENFTQLTRGTVIRFPEDTILLVEEENTPCVNPGQEIAKVYNHVNPSHFVKAAMGMRGLVGVVYRSGIVRINDVVDIKVYRPKAYSLPPRQAEH